MDKEITKLSDENKQLEESLKESNAIIKEIKEGKRVGYTDTESLFEALDSDD